jgi:hypothetical protein
MSLRECIEDIADQIDKDVTQWREIVDKPHAVVWSPERLVDEYARVAAQLRMVLKASQYESGAVSMGQLSSQLPMTSPLQEMKESARRDVQELKNILVKEDTAPRFVILVGGPHDGTALEIPGDMPLGAKTIVDGKIYQLIPNGLKLME